MSDDRQPSSLTSRVIAGGLWGLAGTLAQSVLAIASALVIARFLAPEDYAVAAISGAIVGLAARLGQIGLSETIVRERERLDAVCRASLGALGILGLVLALGVGAASPLAARFYDDSRLVAVLPLAALSLLLGMVTSVPRAILQRRFALRETNAIDVLQRTITALGGIALAALGAGFWALVIPGVTAVVLVAPLTFVLARFAPRPSFDLSPLRGALRFGSGVFAARTLTYVSNEVDYFVLGRYLPKADYGHYYFAFTRAYLPYTMIGPAVQEPLFAAFSEIGADLARMRHAVLRVARVHFFLFAPAGAALFALADPLVPLVFGPQWEASVPLCRVFALMTLLSAAGGFTGAVMFALGRSWLMSALNVVRLVAVIGALAWGVVARASVVEIATVVTATQMVVLAGHLVVLYGLLRTPLASVLRCYAPTLAACAAGAAMPLVATAFDVREAIDHAWLEALALTGLFALGFVPAAALFNRAELAEAKEALAARRRRTQVGA